MDFQDVGPILYIWMEILNFEGKSKEPTKLSNYLSDCRAVHIQIPESVFFEEGAVLIIKGKWCEKSCGVSLKPCHPETLTLALIWGIFQIYIEYVQVPISCIVLFYVLGSPIPHLMFHDFVLLICFMILLACNLRLRLCIFQVW